ncbi:MAG: hypothetical protein WBG01_17740 [Bacteroidota bacterium]
MSIRTSAVLLALAFLAPDPTLSQVYLTKAGALNLHFAQSDSIQRRTVYLTEQQVTTIEQKARATIDSRVITYYVARVDGKNTGYAFFDRQTVRTMPVVYMVVVDPDTTVRAVEILAFHEPEDYLPTERWLAQYEGTALHDDLWLKRGIQNVVGATLSAQTLTQGVRRVLALFEVAVAGGG